MLTKNPLNTRLTSTLFASFITKNPGDPAVFTLATPARSSIVLGGL